jgi:DoxX-like family
VAASGKVVWTGRVISILVALVFVVSALMKVKGGSMVTEGMTHLGLPETMRLPLAVIEFSCAVIYLIPATAVLGAILLTGFIGGAMCTHWRIGEPVFMHIVLGILLWLGLYLREDRLRALIPLRRR